MVGLILTDDGELARLNRTAMGHRGPTDVLSFPLLPPSAFPAHPGQRRGPDDAPRPAFVLPPGARRWLGEIVVSVPRAAIQASQGRGGQDGRQRWSTADELRLLVTHGTLHLCGWDHADPLEAPPCAPWSATCSALPSPPASDGLVSGRTRRALPLPTLPTPPRASGRAARLARLVRDVLRLEDVVLIVWVAAAAHRAAGVGAGSGAGAGRRPGPPRRTRPARSGCVALGAVAGALVCLATRAADPSTGARAHAGRLARPSVR